ncbi:MAG: MATE family efflux transporter [Spirochaetales bacterium]|nr:MATE family efflux transporter [Spirochaetales bacterium]
MTNDRIELLGKGTISRALRTLAIPAVISMLVNAIYNVVDTAFIGLLHDTASIGAAAIVFPIFMLVGAIGLTFGMGAASDISRKIGANQIEDACKTAATAFYTCLIVGVTFGVLGNIYIVPIMKLFGATDTILEKSVVYGRIIITGSVFQILNMCMNNMIRSEGAAAYSGRALMLGGILNIVFDPIFMFVFKMGLAGAAAATISAQFVSTIYLLRYFIMKKGIIKIHPRYFYPRTATYAAIMTIGIPTFVRQVLMSVSLGLLNSAAAHYGDAAIAAIGITMRVISIVMMVIFGIGQGLQPLAGFNYGAKQYDRVIKATHKALSWAVTFSLCVGIIFFIFAKPVIGFFSKDVAVIEIGIKTIKFLSMTLVLVAVQNTYGILFQAIGKGLKAGLLAITRQGLFFIPLIFILPNLWGVNGVIGTQPISDALTFLLAIPMAFFQIRQLNRLKDESENNNIRNE